MKKLFFLTILLLFFTIGCLSGCSFDQVEETHAATDTTFVTEEQATEMEPVVSDANSFALQYADIKAMWLSQYDLKSIYLDGEHQRDEVDFISRMEEVLDNVKSLGFNTIFLQIRPNADSMYPSIYYPTSAYVVGELGDMAQYDPVDIIVSLAHERGLSIHAWVNPMRGMTEEEILLVDSLYPMRQWFDDPKIRGRYMVLVDGRWYLNPAYGEVVDLICFGAEEALNRYDFDGLHIDDYFYPTTDASFDAEAYSDYLSAGGKLDLADYRRSVVSGLVSGLHEVTINSGEGCIFGISPAGNVDKVFNEQYADVYRWCREEGYIDYICPQVYFGMEHGTHDFVKVSNAYQDMIHVDSVALIIGMTFGKAYSREDPWAGSGKDEWKNHSGCAGPESSEHFSSEALPRRCSILLSVFL